MTRRQDDQEATRAGDGGGRIVNDKLTPPAGHGSWLDYAVKTMETRDLFNDVHLVDDGQENRHAWPRDTQREDMRASAKRELEELRQLAMLGEKYLALDKTVVERTETER